MSQLFLAVLKTVTGCCQGCSLSRYGPAPALLKLFAKNVSNDPLSSLEAPAPPPTAADMATLTKMLTLLPANYRENNGEACLQMLVRKGRKTTLCHTALLRMLGFNALEAPLLI